jgi:GTP-dependent phosphoenolpyruvate carboxykinase
MDRAGHVVPVAGKLGHVVPVEDPYLSGIVTGKVLYICNFKLCAVAGKWQLAAVQAAPGFFVLLRTSCLLFFIHVL